MDLVTDAQVAIALTVPVPRERMWDLITAVDRVGEWSPEAFGGAWADGAQGPRRLVTLCRNMITTVGAMVTTDTAIGAAR